MTLHNLAMEASVWLPTVRFGEEGSVLAPHRGHQSELLITSMQVWKAYIGNPSCSQGYVLGKCCKQ